MLDDDRDRIDVLGGPPEWKTRESGVPGLKAVYGITFKEFKPLDDWLYYTKRNCRKFEPFNDWIYQIGRDNRENSAES